MLGSKLIDGITALGSRAITTYPAGSQGNQLPFTVMSEQWYSTDLDIMLLRISDDSRSEPVTSRTSILSHAEPDPKLFQAPAGYRIIDETGTFTIRY